MSASELPAPGARRILGIDPGLNVTGYGALEGSPRGLRLVEAGVVRSTRGESLADRLVEIYDGVAEAIACLKPTAVALEQLYSHTDHPRTSILMGHARGVICLAATKAGLPVLHYSATQIKKVLTGAGRAPKSQIQQSIMRELRLDRLPEPADVADALAVALCHYYLAREDKIADRSATGKRPRLAQRKPADEPSGRGLGYERGLGGSRRKETGS